MESPDLLVVGGGPAGLAAALAARRKGLRVVVADPARPPIDKACGEGLMPDALDALSRLGVNLTAEDGATFRGIRFAGYGWSSEASFPQGSGLGVRRTRLHTVLSEHAQAAGVELRWGTPVYGIESGSALVGNRRVRFRYLAGADGGNSNVRRWAGLDKCARDGMRLGFRRHYEVAPWSQNVEVHWARGCQIYVTPVAARCVCVALLVRDPSQRLEQALQYFPEISERLAGAAVLGPERGGASAFRRLRRVVQGNVALTGDASGSVDAVTGEGLSLAFRQAAALGDALAHEDLEEYQRAHERIRQGPDWMATLLLTMDRSDWLCRRALRVLAGRPNVFSSMLAAHVGRSSPALFASALCSLGWGLLTT